MAKTPAVALREVAGIPDPGVGGTYFFAGVVKSAEAFVRPEIPTALGATGRYLMQRPQTHLGGIPLISPVRPTRPFEEYAKSLPPGYRGRAEFLGELAGEYLIGRYVVGPALEKGYKKAKTAASAIKKKLTGKTVETGFKRTAFGTKGWEYETIRGAPGQPQFPAHHPYIRQEGMEEFLTQTARATQKPVPVHIPKETPWRVIIKHPPTPLGGGLTQTVLRSEISDLSKLALHGVSKKTMLAPYMMAAYAPKPTSIIPSLFALGISTLTKAVTKPKAPKIKPSTFLEVPEAFEPKMPPIQKLTPKPRVLVAPSQELKRKAVPLIKPSLKVPQILVPKQRRRLLPRLAPTQVVKAAQIQKQMQTQIQRQMQVHAPPQMKVPQIFEGPKRKRKRKRKEDDMLGLYGRYPRFYPVASAKQFLKMVIG